MKLPATIGQKKTKAIEQVLEELGLGKCLNTSFPKLFLFKQFDFELIVTRIIFIFKSRKKRNQKIDFFEDEVNCSIEIMYNGWFYFYIVFF